MKTYISIKFRKILICLIVLSASLAGASQESYEKIYDRLKSKIESELRQPPGSTNDLNLYLSWMAIKARDRDAAEKLSSKAGKEGNPYWQNKFVDLADQADNSGESTKLDAMFKLMRSDDRAGNPAGYAQACYAAGPRVGERIFNTAAENGFITVDIKERARCLMRYATNDLEGRWLYASHDSFLGKYDSDGFQILPSGDWSVTCLRRGEFTTTNQGDPLPSAETGMKMVQEVRDICEFYHLDPEYDDATDLMVQYLKDKKVLCLMPPNEGHGWYIDLAQRYELDKAKEHMEGFYATIKGKIEKEENGVRKPVPNAEVEFEASKDQQSWTVKSDQIGNYKIENVLLHKSCGPFILIARGDGCYKQEEIPGPLEEPDKGYELEKNLLLDCGVTGYSGRITVTKSWDYKKTSGQSTSTYIGKQTITFNGIFKPKKEIKEMMAGQPIKFYESASVTGKWTHNEDRYCEGPGCGNCKGLVYQEYGSGSLSPFTISMITIITYSFPTSKKGVADQLAQFGLSNWYDISAPGENVPIQRRTTHETQYGCEWENSTSTTNLIGVDLLRYKLEDINNLKGSVSWKSHMGTHGISATNMPEALSGQKPFDPEQDGTDYTYTITWKLTIL